MKNADKPVHPGSVVDPEARRILFDIKSEAEWSAQEFRHAVNSFERYAGLTKREHFAAMAMQGFLANAWQAETLDSLGECSSQQMATVAEASCVMADALLAELEKETHS